MFFAKCAAAVIVAKGQIYTAVLYYAIHATWRLNRTRRIETQ